MRTDDLIRTLAADHAKAHPRLRPSFIVALALGFVVALGLFLLLLSPRPDIAAVATSPRFLLKFAVTLSLAGAASVFVVRLVRPGAPTRPAAFLLVGAPVLLAIGVLFELIAVPSAQWGARLVGTNALVCLTFIPLLSVPLLIAVLASLRGGAPIRPSGAGAVAGLVASAFAASLYAAHCTDDSPLFVATWYTAAMLLVVIVGAVAGRRALRW